MANNNKAQTLSTRQRFEKTVQFLLILMVLCLFTENKALGAEVKRETKSSSPPAQTSKPTSSSTQVSKSSPSKSIQTSNPPSSQPAQVSKPPSPPSPTMEKKQTQASPSPSKPPASPATATKPATSTPASSPTYKIELPKTPVGSQPSSPLTGQGSTVTAKQPAQQTTANKEEKGFFGGLVKGITELSKINKENEKKADEGKLLELRKEYKNSSNPAEKEKKVAAMEQLLNKMEVSPERKKEYIEGVKESGKHKTEPTPPASTPSATKPPSGSAPSPTAPSGSFGSAAVVGANIGSKIATEKKEQPTPSTPASSPGTKKVELNTPVASQPSSPLTGQGSTVTANQSTSTQQTEQKRVRRVAEPPASSTPASIPSSTNPPSGSAPSPTAPSGGFGSAAVAGANIGGKIATEKKEQPTTSSPLTGQGSTVTTPPIQASKSPLGDNINRLNPVTAPPIQASKSPSPPKVDFHSQITNWSGNPIVGIVGDSFTQKSEKNGTKVEMNLFNTRSADAALEIYDKNGNLQKTVIIPGNRASTDVTVSNPIKGATNFYEVEKRVYEAATDPYSIADKRDRLSSEKTPVSVIVPQGGSMKIGYNSGAAIAHNMLTLVTEALDLKLSKKEDVKTLNDVLQKIDLPKIIVNAKAGSSNTTDLAEKVLQGVLSEVAKEGGTKLAFDKIVGEKAAEKVSKALAGVPILTKVEEVAGKVATGAVTLGHLNDVVLNLVNGAEEVVITPEGSDSKLSYSKSKTIAIPAPAKTETGTTVLESNIASGSSESLKIESKQPPQDEKQDVKHTAESQPQQAQSPSQEQDGKKGVKRTAEVLPQQQTTPTRGSSPALNLTTLSTATLDIKKEENHLTTVSRRIQSVTTQPTPSSQSSQTGQSGGSSTQPTAAQSSQPTQSGTSSVQTNVIIEQLQPQTGTTNAANTKFDDIKIDFVKKTRVKVDVIF